jgi:RNA polymerase sigma factor (sigma-70 family)
MSTDSDSTLLQQFIRDQDSVAFNHLARRYRGMVFAAARRVTRSHHDAEDVAQGCFLDLARKAESIRSSVAAFLHTTATRRAIDLLREQNRRRKYERDAGSDRADPVIEDPAQRSWDEISPEVDRAIDRLPEDLRTPIILFFLRGLSAPEIALETGLNKGMVERRLQVGVRRLRADLRQDGRQVAVGTLAVGFKASLSATVPARLTAATGRIALAARLNDGAPAGRTLPSPGQILNFLRSPPAGGFAAALLVCGAFWGAFWGATIFWPHVATSSDGPYDQMARMYAPFLQDNDLAGFSRHCGAMKADLSAFWRGSQPLFFQWCREHCRDWLDDRDAYCLCRASPNLEDAERFPSVVNADDSARLPIQIELLQGLIVARLTTDREVRSDGPTTVDQIAAEMCAAYQTELTMPADLSGFSDESSASSKDSGEYSRFIDNAGNFRPLILGQQERVAEILHPTDLTPERASAMLESAGSRNPTLIALMGSARPTVRAVRERIRHDSVVTQGQSVFLVQLANKPILLQLTEQIPSPAEMAGAVAPDPRLPARRAAEDAAALLGSLACPVGWCQDLRRTYTVAPLTPSVYELRKYRWVDPSAAVRKWATATAATHRADPHRAHLAVLITPAMQALLVRRSDAYLKFAQAELVAFRNDPRVARDQSINDALCQRWLREAVGLTSDP